MTHALRATCRLCGAPLPSEKVLDLGNVPLANEYWSDHPELEQETFPLYVVACSQCGHAQTPVVVDPKRLFSADYAYRSGNAGDFKEHLAGLADHLESCDAGFLHVDVGSNDGTLVRLLCGHGMRAIGVDPASNLAAEASQSGALTIPAFLTPGLATDLVKLVGAGATVTALNVFAHADDLSSLAQALRIICGDKGQLIIEVADVSEVIRKGDVSTVYFEHLSHHSLRPLVAFLARHCLVVTDAQKIPVQGGSIRVYASASGQRWATPMPEDDIADFDPPPFSEWQPRADKNAAALREKILPYLPTNDGGWDVGEAIPTPSRLAVFGAPARLTALAYSLKLQRGDVSCVFDDEPRKVGKFTPGLHWPIVSSAELMARNPPAILVASWNYFDHIRSRFPEYRGEWIVPNREASLADETATIDAREAIEFEIEGRAGAERTITLNAAEKPIETRPKGTTDRAPPGKTWLVEYPGAEPRLIDFPPEPEIGWFYCGHAVSMIDRKERWFTTEGGSTRHSFDDWREWGEDWQPE